MSNENNFIPELQPYKKISPFRLYVKSNFPFIENTYESLDNYGLYCKVVEYLNKVIANENTVETNVQALYNAFVELNTYVSNYFDNLDVQEEINNKLDDMVEQGTLQEIIASYLNSKAIFGFDTVADMKNATNLINGSYAETAGFHSKNDGGCALYKIRNITNDDVVDNMYIISMNDSENELVAELIDNDITPEKLGAYGDGIHDDSVVLNAFFENLKDKEHIFLTKNYAVSKGIKLPSGYGITITGGTFTALSNFDNSDSNAIFYMPSTSVEQPDGYGVYATGLRISDITFLCNWYADGIQFPRSLNLTIDKCMFLYYKDYGINVTTIDNHDLLISNCQFRGNGYDEHYVENVTNTGIKLSCPDSIITSCIFAYGHCGLELIKGSNIIEHCHFYAYQNNGYNVKFGDYNNIMNDCYLDGGSLWLSSGWINKMTNLMMSINDSSEFLIKVSTDHPTDRQASFLIDGILVYDQRTDKTIPINLISYDNNITTFDNTIIKNVKIINGSLVVNNPFNDIKINDINPTFFGSEKYVASVNTSTGEIGARTSIDGSTQYYKSVCSGNTANQEFIGDSSFWQFLILPIYITERTRIQAIINSPTPTDLYYYDTEFNYLGKGKITLEKGKYYVAFYRNITSCVLTS